MFLCCFFQLDFRDINFFRARCCLKLASVFIYSKYRIEWIDIFSEAKPVSLGWRKGRFYRCRVEADRILPRREFLFKIVFFGFVTFGILLLAFTSLVVWLGLRLTGQSLASTVAKD